MTISAAFDVQGGGTHSWNLVTDASTLTAGDIIVIAAYNVSYKTSGNTYIDNKVMGAISSSIGTVIDVTFNSTGTTIESLPAGARQYTLGGNYTDGWTLKNGSNYLSIKEDKKIQETTTESTWSISINSNEATMTQSAYPDHTLQYNPNSGNGRFTAYYSNQKPIRIYRYE